MKGMTMKLKSRRHPSYPSSVTGFQLAVHALSWRHTWHQLNGIKNVGASDPDEIRHNDRSMHITHWYHTSTAIKLTSLFPKYQL